MSEFFLPGGYHVDVVDLSELSDSLTELSDALGRRLFVLDDRFRVVAYTFHQSEEERSRLSFVLAHSDSWYPLGHRVNDVYTSQIPGLGVRVLVALRGSDGQLIGYVLLILSTGDEPAPSDLDLIMKRAPQLGIFLATQLRLTSDLQARSKLLLEGLLGDDEQTRTGAADALLRERLVGRSSHYCAMVLAPPSEGSSDALIAARAASAVLDFIHRFSTATVVGSSLDSGLGVLIFPRRVVSGRAEQILGQAGLHSVRIGIGPMVDQLEKARRSFDRAHDAWRLACIGEGTSAIYWDDMGLDRLLVRLPLSDLELEDLPLGLQRLFSSNLRSVFVTTLDRYLSLGGDAMQTAKDLRIHRSTLYYRLERLRLVMECDLSDGDVRRELHTGLRVAQLAELGFAP